MHRRKAELIQEELKLTKLARLSAPADLPDELKEQTVDPEKAKRNLMNRIRGKQKGFGMGSAPGIKGVQKPEKNNEDVVEHDSDEEVKRKFRKYRSWDNCRWIWMHNYDGTFVFSVILMCPTQCTTVQSTV